MLQSFQRAGPVRCLRRVSRFQGFVCFRSLCQLRGDSHAFQFAWDRDVSAGSWIVVGLTLACRLYFLSLLFFHHDVLETEPGEVNVFQH